MKNIKIKTKSKSDQVVDRFIQAILEGEYSPGDRVPTEFDLANMFGVSRITIREAFKNLSLMGLVSIQEGRGTYISEPSPVSFMEPLLTVMILNEKDLAALYEARLCLESGMAGLAAIHATEDDISKLTEIHRTMENNYIENDENANKIFSFSDKKFHETLAEASHNEYMIHIYKTLFKIYRSYIEKTTSIKMGREASVKEHNKILIAIRNKDAQAAELAMKEHILMAYELFKKCTELSK